MAGRPCRFDPFSKKTRCFPEARLAALCKNLGCFFQSLDPCPAGFGKPCFGNRTPLTFEEQFSKNEQLLLKGILTHIQETLTTPLTPLFLYSHFGFGGRRPHRGGLSGGLVEQTDFVCVCCSHTQISPKAFCAQAHVCPLLYGAPSCNGEPRAASSVEVGAPR